MNPIKQIQAAAIAFAMTVSATAATVATDSIVSFSSSRTIVITENHEGIKVISTTVDNSSDKETIYSRTYTSGTPVRTHQRTTTFNSIALSSDDSFSITSGGLGFGFVNAPDAPAALDLEMGKSFELSWLYLLAADFKFRPWSNSVRIGIGLDWRNYKTTGPARFLPDADGNLTIDSYPDNSCPHSSRVKVFSLCLPLTYTQYLPVNYPWGGRLAITAGAIACFNTHASVENSWTNDKGNRVTQSTSSIHPRRVTFDIFGAVNLSSWLSIYARYSPITILEPGCGPQFKSFSTGLIIGL